MARTAPLVLLLVLLVGCQSSKLRDASSPTVVARVQALQAEVRETWHLPLRVRTLAEPGVTLGEPAHKLILSQLDAFTAALRRSPFDVFALDVILCDRDEGRVRLDPNLPRLTIELPATATKPLDTDAILAEWAARYRWERDTPWHVGVEPDLLESALRRDLDKLALLEERLHRHARQLELLAASLRSRARRTREAVHLTPSEARFARRVWFSATFSLFRTLNTLARWRQLGLDSSSPLAPVAQAILRHGRWSFAASLGWLLETVVGGRSLGKLWRRDFWQRNPLYTLLDSEVPLTELEGVPIQLPAGSVAALLKLRLDGDLYDWFQELDEHTLKPAPEALRPAVRKLLQHVPRLQRLSKERGLSGFRAWKELWDSRLKRTVSFPLYEAVAGIARFLGHTRVSVRGPAISSVQLHTIAKVLRPGDVILARGDGFLSNAFLPGFWPHAILYLGPAETWTQLRRADGSTLGEASIVKRLLKGYRQADEDGHPPRVIEAISAGVLFSSLEHAVRKDYAVVFRPQLSEAVRAEAILRALTLHGRPYDFDFDFQSDDKIVCTELIYRAYNGDFNFRVGIDAKKDSPAKGVPGVLEVMGRKTMPANEIARYAIYMHDHPDAQPGWGYPGDKLELLVFLDRSKREARLLRGEAAWATLRESVDR
jgi:hypothetical protein